MIVDETTEWGYFHAASMATSIEVNVIKLTSVESSMGFGGSWWN